MTIIVILYYYLIVVAHTEYCMRLNTEKGSGQGLTILTTEATKYAYARSKELLV